MEVREKLKQWFSWYIANQDEIVKEYNGKYVVIKDCKIVSVYDDENKAYFASKKQFGLGNFIIQLCTPGDESYSVHLSTPYVFTASV